MTLAAVPPLRNAGAFGTWLSANPASTLHLQVSSAGVVSTSAFDGSFGTLTGKPTTLSGYGITDAQPQDSDLTAIAALTTTSFGRSLLTQADAAAARSTLSAFATTGGTLTGLLQFSGTSHAGIRLNNLTSAQVSALASPQAGMAVWDTDLARMRVHNGTSFTNGFVRLDGDTMTGTLLATGFEARNGLTATSVLVNNTWTSSTNRETGYMRWASNILSIGTEKGSGGGTARALQFDTDGAVRLRIEPTLPIVSIGSAAGRAVIQSFAGTNSSNASDGTGIAFVASTTANGDSSFAFAGSSFATTSGTNRFVDIVRTFAPTSGTAAFNSLEVRPTINQTGGASGVTRGFHVAPILTAAADWRSYDCNNNTGFAYHSSGTAPSRLGGNFIWVPASSTTLATNGQMAIEMTSNTAGNIVYRGSDGTTRRFPFTVS